MPAPTTRPPSPSTADGTATAGKDYTALAPVTLAFAPGETVKHVTVSGIGDTIDEDDETFTVNLTNPANVTVAPSAGNTTVTITDDDAAPTVTISDADVVEGDSGSAPMSLTVTLSAASGKAVQ